MHADGELTPDQEQKLMSFLFDHPELQSELTAFSMSKMIPDTTIVYTAKDELLKPTGDKKVIAFPSWQRYAVAAGVAAVFFISFYRFTGNIQDNAGTGAAVANPTPAPTAPIPANPIQAPAVQTKNETAPATPQLAAATTTKKTRTHNTPVTPAHHEPTENNTAAPSGFAVATTNIEPLSTDGIRISNETPEIIATAVTNVPVAAININNDNYRETLLDKLPLTDTKKEGMKNVATALASGYDRVNAIRQDITGSSITLKVEKRKLIVSF